MTPEPAPLWGQNGNYPYYLWEGEPDTLKYYPIEDEV